MEGSAAGGRARPTRGTVPPDAEYAEAFGETGPAGWSPGRLALVTVFQLVEHLTDRQVDAVRDRLSWMYALGLNLADTGFDHTVLTSATGYSRAAWRRRSWTCCWHGWSSWACSRRGASTPRGACPGRLHPDPPLARVQSGP
ncbi:hypothetical protein GCM10010519_34890 [Streptomyces lactacystinicus]